MTVVLPTVDLRSQFAPVRDQGNRPTCLAFATSDVHGAILSSESVLSCEYLYYYAQKIGGRDANSGATVPDILAALKREGQPLETEWPYLKNLSDQMMEDWKPPIEVGPVFRRGGESCGQLIDEVIRYLDAGTNVISLIFLCEPFFAAREGHIIEASEMWKPNVSLRHAVVACGYGMSQSGRCILIRNSWGEGWGEDGYAWIAEDLFEASLFEIVILKDLSYVSSNYVAT